MADEDINNFKAALNDKISEADEVSFSSLLVFTINNEYIEFISNDMC